MRAGVTAVRRNSESQALFKRLLGKSLATGRILLPRGL